MPQVSDSDKSDVNQGDESTLDEFDLAFDEALAEDSEPPADAGGDDADPEGPQAENDTPPGSDAEARTVQPAGGDAPPADQPSTDIWANAPPELKAAHEAALGELQTKFSRTKGQLSAADRELARLRKESGARPAATEGDQGGEQGDPFESDEIKKFKEEYGEIADPVLNLLKLQQNKIAQLEAPVAEVAQQRATQARESEISVFTTAHPDWETYVTDERYFEWLETQPKAVQEAAARAVNVEDGQEAAWLLTQFKASIGAASATPEHKADNREGNQQPLADLKRSRQLAAGRDGGGSSPPVQSGLPDNFDDAVEAIIASRSRKQSRPGQF